MNSNITIGLFGTCDNSTWRDKFISEYNKLKIIYYNPQVKEGTWKPENAVIEANHLANDDIILFPVLSESYGLGSLAETGFSIINSINLNRNRHTIILIDSQVENLGNPELVKESNKMRKLVKSHCQHLNLSNVHIVNNLDNMLEVSLKLHEILLLRNSIKLIEE